MLAGEDRDGLEAGDRLLEGRDLPQAGTKLVTLRTVSDLAPGVRIKPGGTRGITLPAGRRICNSGDRRFASHQKSYQSCRKQTHSFVHINRHPRMSGYLGQD